jgi:hypothetical protein
MSSSAVNLQMHQLVNLVRCIDKFVLENKDVLNSEGIFRIAGNYEAVEGLIEQFNQVISACHVDSEHFFQATFSEESNQIHNIVNTIPKAINKLNFSKDKVRDVDWLLPLIDLMSSDVLGDESIHAIAQFEELIDGYLSSDNLLQQQVGEIIYRYANLLKRSEFYVNTTKMNSVSLGIILGVNLENLFFAFQKDSSIYEKVSNFNNFATILIDSDYAELPFEHKFKNNMENLVLTRKNELGSLYKLKRTIKNANKVESLMMEYKRLQIEKSKLIDHLKVNFQEKEQVLKLLSKLEDEQEPFSLMQSISKYIFKKVNHDNLQIIKVWHKLQGTLIRMQEIKINDLPCANKNTNAINSLLGSLDSEIGRLNDSYTANCLNLSEEDCKEGSSSAEMEKDIEALHIARFSRLGVTFYSVDNENKLNSDISQINKLGDYPS